MLTYCNRFLSDASDDEHILFFPVSPLTGQNDHQWISTGAMSRNWLTPVSEARAVQSWAPTWLGLGARTWGLELFETPASCLSPSFGAFAFTVLMMKGELQS